MIAKGHLKFRRITVVMAIAGITAVAATANAFQLFLGPENPSGENGFGSWQYGVAGGSSVSIGNDGPGESHCAFRIEVTNTIPGKKSVADLRSDTFLLEHNGTAGGPFNLSFAYKFPGKVRRGDNIELHFRFFDRTETNFLGEKIVHLGSKTHDSNMTEYKTKVVTGIVAPSRAVVADIWVTANVFVPWNSGEAEFADFSVTTAGMPSWAETFGGVGPGAGTRAKTGAGVFVVLGALVLWMLYMRYKHPSRMAPIQTGRKRKIAAIIGVGVIMVAAAVLISSRLMDPSIRQRPTDWTVLGGDTNLWHWNNGIIQVNNTFGDSLLLSGRKYSNMTMSVIADATTREASVAFRMQDVDHGYLVVFVPSGTPWAAHDPNDCRFLHLEKRYTDAQGFHDALLGVYQGAQFAAAGRKAKIAVTTFGPYIEVRFNDVKVLETRDDTYTNGYVGLRTAGDPAVPCDATFSSLTIR